MLLITGGGGGGGGGGVVRFWEEEGVDSGGVHNLPPGYTLESTPRHMGGYKMKGGIIWRLTPAQSLIIAQCSLTKILCLKTIGLE